MSLCFSDFLNGVVLLPCFLVLGLAHPLLKPLIMLILLSSIGNVLALAIDRWVAIGFALRYKNVVRRSRVKLSVISIWLFSMLVTSVPKFAGPQHEHSPKLRQMFLGVILVVLFITSLFLIAIYGYIYLLARRHRYLITAQINMGRPSINKTKVFV